MSNFKTISKLYTEAVEEAAAMKVEQTGEEHWYRTSKEFIRMVDNDPVEDHKVVFFDEPTSKVCVVRNKKIAWFDYDEETYTAKEGEPPEEITLKNNGLFQVSGTEITTLEDCPAVINGNFDCSNNKDLHALEGGPKKVTGSYTCCQNPTLVSLEGAPEFVGRDFNCHNCDMLTSFKGLENTKIGNDLICSYTISLTSPEGLPPAENIGREIKCDTKLEDKLKIDPAYSKLIGKTAARTNKVYRKVDADSKKDK